MLRVESGQEAGECFLTSFGRLWAAGCGGNKWCSAKYIGFHASPLVGPPAEVYKIHTQGSVIPAGRDGGLLPPLPKARLRIPDSSIPDSSVTLIPVSDQSPSPSKSPSGRLWPALGSPCLPHLCSPRSPYILFPLHFPKLKSKPAGSLLKTLQ